MANTKAYTYNIMPNSKSTDEHGLVHQSSPTWVLTFVRWEFRDTLRTKNSYPDTVREPLVVENDCINVSTIFNKGTLTPQMSATLMETDVNYEVALSPGDFVFVNMLNWESDARRVATKARNGEPINEIYDGFKGIYKIQGVRKSVVTEPETGIKRVFYKINGFAFTEFNNTVYFNPNLIVQKNLENQALFINDIAHSWANFLTQSGIPAIQEIIAFLIQCLIGSGIDHTASTVEGLIVSPNTHFLVPILVGRLLGVVSTTATNRKDFTSVVAAKDIYRYLFGIQQYGSANNKVSLAQGMNPSNLQSTDKYPGFLYTDTLCKGSSRLLPEYWNQVKTWAILNQYTNSPLNELYTCFRVSTQGRIMPTVVFRQIPFTNEDFVTQQLGTADSVANTISITRFLSLPRWRIDSAFVFDVDLGKDEAARVNFVQYYSKSNFSDKGVEISGETATVNYIFDADDISRSGLRPYIAQVQFDDLLDSSIQNGKFWARILGDSLIGGHLKISGTMNCIGITEPIAVGDNLEFDHTVYHIEQITHTCNETSAGVKSFRTTLSLSSGISVDSSSSGTVYSQMTYASAYKDRAHDAQYQQILPGVSESQDVPYRTIDQNTNNSQAFPQPTIIPNNIKTGD